MNKFELFLQTKGITKEQFADKSAEEMAGLYNEFNSKQSEELKSLVDNKADKADIEKAMQELRDSQMEQMKSLNEAIKEMGLAIKASTEGAKVQRAETLKDALAKKMDVLEAIKGGSNDKLDLVVKVAGTMLESTNISGGNVPVEQRLPGLNTINSRRVRLMDIVNNGVATSNIISWVYQANKDGAAGGTVEGAAKNQIDFDLVVASQPVVKRTAFIKVSTEMLTDIDFIQSEINNELMRELMKDVELTAYSGNGTAPNMNGVFTTATAFTGAGFTGAGGGIVAPNIADVLVVAMNQIEVAEGMANYILMNPTDVNRLLVLKDTTNEYLGRLVMANGQMMLDGVPIVKTTLVTAGTYLVGDFTKATLYTKENINIQIGLNNDDFVKNLRTILSEYRGCMVVKNNDRVCFVKGTFATDISTITKP
jgi:HK97 family phage major capsid protein